MGNLSPDPAGRRYPSRPILGVGAIILNHGKVLLVERGSEPLRGYWSLPGGVLEAGELLKDGIRREVREETGLEVEPVSMAGVYERILRDAENRPEYHYVLIDYVCRVTGGELAAASDARRAAWMDRGALAGCLLTEGTLEVIEEAFANAKHDS